MAPRLGIMVLAVLWLFAPAVGATNGKTILYGGGGQGRVTFDGQLHAAKGYVCNDCHLQLFPTWKKGLITFADHKTPTLCFACHNGEVAFKSCSGCHRDVPEPAAAVPATPPPPLTHEGAASIGSKTFVPVVGPKN